MNDVATQPPPYENCSVETLLTMYGNAMIKIYCGESQSKGVAAFSYEFVTTPDSPY
jgi:hypothetical protein